MTKTVRIENACTAGYKVKVYAQRRVVNNETGETEWQDCPEPAIDLSHPTQLKELTIWDGRRLVIEENGSK